jgi:hypothetical protein
MGNIMPLVLYIQKQKLIRILHIQKQKLISNIVGASHTKADADKKYNAICTSYTKADADRKYYPKP